MARRLILLPNFGPILRGSYHMKNTDPETRTVEPLCGPRMPSTRRQRKTHCDLQLFHHLLLTRNTSTVGQRSKPRLRIQQLGSLWSVSHPPSHPNTLANNPRHITLLLLPLPRHPVIPLLIGPHTRRSSNFTRTRPADHHQHSRWSTLWPSSIREPPTLTRAD